MKALFPGSEKIQQKFELNLVEIEPDRAHRVGPVEVTPFIAAHNAGAPAFTLRISCEGKTLTYSGDTAWCDSLVRAADGADLLVVESSGYEKVIPQHLDYGTLSRRRGELKARVIVLTHMGPEMLANCDSVKGFELAEDGKSFQV
jgi:ribonuclease BN (tRNA processing enzyme)